MADRQVIGPEGKQTGLGVLGATISAAVGMVLAWRSSPTSVGGAFLRVGIPIYRFDFYQACQVRLCNSVSTGGCVSVRIGTHQVRCSLASSVQ